MFQDGLGVVPRDLPLTLGTQDLPRLALTGGLGTLQAVHDSRASELDKGPVSTVSVLSPSAGPHGWAITPATMAEGHLPCVMGQVLLKTFTSPRHSLMIHPKAHLRIPCYDFYSLFQAELACLLSLPRAAREQPMGPI